MTIQLIKTKTRERINKIFHGAHNHYLCCLPKNIGFLSSLTLSLFFSGIKIKQEQTSIIQKLPQESIVIYATKYKSSFEYLFYYTRYKHDKLPVPEIGFNYKIFIWQPVSRILRAILSRLDITRQWKTFLDPYKNGYIKHELINGKSGLLSLIEKKGFYQRFVKEKTDPICYLINMQKSIDRPIFIIPQIMFFGKKPLKASYSIIDILFGSGEKPGKIRRLVTLFKNPGNVFVEISEPVNLKHFLQLDANKKQTSQRQALILRNYLLDQANRHRQSTVGPTLKSKEVMKENILTNNRLRDFMHAYSKKRKITIWRVHKKANAYLDEIAAQYNVALISILASLVKWFLNTMFDGVTINESALQKVKAMSRKGPLILIPCHKSHIDYLILSYILFLNDMPCPHIAAGKNLSFWPLGPIFRNSGAFFIRRTFKGAVLYSKVFTEYIYKLLEDGFNIEIFIEGTRSRTGKLLSPKLGFLSMLLNAYKNGACKNMIFAPIYIGYDRVLEESSYLREIEGGKKKPESLVQVIKARKFLKKRYGRIYIQFHEPIDLNELLSQNGLQFKDMTSKEQNVFCRNLGSKILNSIDNMSVITPYAIVASAILNFSKKRFSYDQLIDHVEIYMNYLFWQKATLSDTLLFDHIHAINQVLVAYVQRKFIECIFGNMETNLHKAQFKINVSKRPIMEYYKNNCIAFFVSAAFTAMAILEKDAFQFSSSALHSDYIFLQDFFQNEFSQNIDKSPEYLVRKNIKAFIDDAILMPHQTLPDTYNITSAGFRKLKIFAGFLKTYFESYWIALNFFMVYPRNFVKVKNRLKKIESIGKRIYKRKEIERKEALSKINYENAVGFFTTHGVKSSENEEKIKFYSDKIQEYLKYL